MVAWVETSGDLASAATALAGLLLVFLGAVSAAFASYEKTQQRAVLGKYRTRAFLAFAGFILSLVAAGLAIAAKLLASKCLVIAAVCVLALAIVPVVVAAVLTVMEID